MGRLGSLALFPSSARFPPHCRSLYFSFALYYLNAWNRLRCRLWGGRNKHTHARARISRRRDASHQMFACSGRKKKINLVRPHKSIVHDTNRILVSLCCCSSVCTGSIPGHHTDMNAFLTQSTSLNSTAKIHCSYLGVCRIVFIVLISFSSVICSWCKISAIPRFLAATALSNWSPKKGTQIIGTP